MKVIKEEFNGITYLAFECPGCNMLHSIHVTGERAWGWNGSVDSPLCWLEPRADSDEEERKYIASRRCHSFVTDGKIQYLGDCGHKLAGQTVDLPDV